MVAGELERLVTLLEAKTDEYRVYAVDAAEAEVDYKKAFALALLRADGSGKIYLTHLRSKYT